MSGPTFEVRAPDWLTVEEASDRILGSARALESETVPVREALGAALATAHTARATLPPWPNAGMDGYAVRSEDVAGASPANPVLLDVAGAVLAGDASGPPVTPRTAVRIMTGAPVPEGADSVVRVEDTDAEEREGRVRILSDRDACRNVRPAAEDMQMGERLLDEGRTVTPGVIAALAALGLDRVEVVRRPLVEILPTGNELRTPDRYDDVRAGAGVPESNGPMLSAAVSGASGIARCAGPVPDDAEDTRRRVEAAADADVLVFTGGASMGEADLVKRVLDEMGFRQEFWRVRMRPGSPIAFGWLPRDGRPDQAVFSLPGNPASAFVTFELFVRPYLLRVAGHKRIVRRTLRCTAGERLPGPAELTYYLRVRLDDATMPPTARLAGPQGSGLVRTLAVADGLAIVPLELQEIAEGGTVEVILLDDAPASRAGPPAAP